MKPMAVGLTMEYARVPTKRTPSIIRVLGATTVTFSAEPGGGAGREPSDTHLRWDLQMGLLDWRRDARYVAEHGAFVHDLKAASRIWGRTAFMMVGVDGLRKVVRQQMNEKIVRRECH